jgi:hypothetical protein
VGSTQPLTEISTRNISGGGIKGGLLDLEINAERTKDMLLYRHQNAAEIRDIKIANR